MGSNIKGLRIKNMLTIKQVAKKIDISAERYKCVEKGIGKLHINKIYALAYVFNVRPIVLLWK
jgi:transcriptional regulator with XRE-family HTH domain